MYLNVSLLNKLITQRIIVRGTIFPILRQHENYSYISNDRRVSKHQSANNKLAVQVRRLQLGYIHFVKNLLKALSPSELQQQQRELCDNSNALIGLEF